MQPRLYLSQLTRVADLPGRRRLRSSSSQLLQVPPFRRSAVGYRSFPVAASVCWNSLTLDIQSSPLYLFLVNGSRHFFSVNPSHILLWHFCSHCTHFHGLCNSFTIWAALKITMTLILLSLETSGNLFQYGERSSPNFVILWCCSILFMFCQCFDYLT